MKQRFIFSRFGLAAIFLLCISMFSILAVWDIADRFDLPLYDVAMRQRKARSGPVVLVSIDRRSLNRVGRWPWPRRKVAVLVDRLRRSGAETIGLDFSLAGRDPSAVDFAAIEAVMVEALSGKSGKKLRQGFAKLKKKFAGDQLLARAMGRGRVVLGIDTTGIDSVLPSWMSALALSNLTPYPEPAAFANPWPAPPFFRDFGLDLPPARLVRSAGAVGHRLFKRDSDGLVRRQPVFVRSSGQLLPAFSLASFLEYRHRSLAGLRGLFGPRRVLALFSGEERIPLVASGDMLIDFAYLRGMKRVSASRIMAGKKDYALAGAVVIVGPSVAAGGTIMPTPAGDLAVSEIEAAATATLVSSHRPARLPWAWLLELGVMVYLFFFVSLAGPRMGSLSGGLLFSVSAGGWIVAAFVLLWAGGFWFRAVTPVLPGLFAYGLVLLYRRSPARTILDPAVIADNKKVGLAFQSQGLLDLAMDTFMALPAVDPSCRELLYNLALDLERKRMFAKAIVVYERVEKRGGHRDSRERLARVRKVVDMPSLRTALGADVTTVGFTAPTIGRYEIIRELGQGAIGTVYLGRDPKINREVAIKTLRTQEVAGDDLEEVRERFFREAEAAGSLNHPNIVTIYDIGEDDDTTYIAMEVLNGRELSSFCRPEALRSVDEVLRIVIQVASALDYAHKNQVVHRDIKPANVVVMDDGQVKVADFGIARLQTASTYTRTGAILGTPNYMSPEQVEGKKVDGRSDLFSLGVVFYELLSGVKPFKHENVATLMHLIARADFIPLDEVRDGLPSCLYELVARLLARAKSRRFQKAADFEAAARECLAGIDRS